MGLSSSSIRPGAGIQSSITSDILSNLKVVVVVVVVCEQREREKETETSGEINCANILMEKFNKN